MLLARCTAQVLAVAAAAAAADQPQPLWLRCRRIQSRQQEAAMKQAAAMPPSVLVTQHLRASSMAAPRSVVAVPLHYTRADYAAQPVGSARQSSQW